MALKRKAQEAFGKPQAQLSAFAAAKLARESGNSSPIYSLRPEEDPPGNSLAAEAAITPYDGTHSGTTTPDDAPLEQEPVFTAPPKPPKIPFSTFAPTSSNILKDDERCLELEINRGETLTLLGEYAIEILNPEGVITIAGALLLPKHGPRRIFAPSTHPLPQIRVLQDRSILRISSTMSGLRKLERLSPLFRNVWNASRTDARSFSLLGMHEDDTLQRTLNVLEIDKDTDALLKTLSSKTTALPRPPRVIAIGAKSSGKSTFNRLLYNYMHTWTQGAKVSYLDLDPGQPEFTPPGQVSLVEIAGPILGTPFTHTASNTSPSFQLVRSHTIAAMSFRDDPAHYRACVEDLIQHAEQSHPLLVNSCGWVSGPGASILLELVSKLSITDIVLFEPLEPSFMDSLREATRDAAIHRIPRRAPRPASRTPAEARAMQTIAYFHHKPGYANAGLQWSGKPINTTRPWIVKYAGRNPGISAIISYGQQPNPEFLAEVLDGSVVAVVVLDQDINIMSALHETDGRIPEETEDHLPAEVVARTPEGLPYIPANTQGSSRTLDPQKTQCIGLALIRSIDTERQELHLVTPVPENEIARLEHRRVVLVRGGFDPPEWAYLEDLYKSNGEAGASGLAEEARPWVSEKERVGIEGSVWRLRHPPLASSVTAANR